MSETEQKKGFLGRLMALPNDNPTKTLFVAVLLCLACSVMVSATAVVLKPMQQANQKNDIRKNILAVTGLTAAPDEIDAVFERFEVRLLDLGTPNFANTDIDPLEYDQRRASAEPETSKNLKGREDIADIGSRANMAPIYILKDGDDIQQVVLPVHGYGLWSTMYGFLAIDNDFNTISGLRFYEHAETPGLGGEIDNPKWRNQWEGKQIYDGDGNLSIRVIRGFVDKNADDAKYKVDGLSGATLTSRGVTNTMQYWLGEDAFGPYLKRMQSERGNN